MKLVEVALATLLFSFLPSEKLTKFYTDLCTFSHTTVAIGQIDEADIDILLSDSFVPDMESIKKWI